MPSKRRRKLSDKDRNKTIEVTPMSSHPDAEPQPTQALVTDADLREFRAAEPARKPIVSVRGEDLEGQPSNKPKAA